MKAKELSEILLKRPDYDVECLEEAHFFGSVYTQYVTIHEDEHIEVDDINHVIFLGDR